MKPHTSIWLLRHRSVVAGQVESWSVQPVAEADVLASRHLLVRLVTLGKNAA